jgi:hypothetical protein
MYNFRHQLGTVSAYDSWWIRLFHSIRITFSFLFVSKMSVMLMKLNVIYKYTWLL